MATQRRPDLIALAIWFALCAVMCYLASCGAVSIWALTAMFLISVYRSEDAFVREE